LLIMYTSFLALLTNESGLNNNGGYLSPLTLYIKNYRSICVIFFVIIGGQKKVIKTEM